MRYTPGQSRALSERVAVAALQKRRRGRGIPRRLPCLIRLVRFVATPRSYSSRLYSTLVAAGSQPSPARRGDFLGSWVPLSRLPGVRAGLSVAWPRTSESRGVRTDLQAGWCRALVVRRRPLEQSPAEHPNAQEIEWGQCGAQPGASTVYFKKTTPPLEYGDEQDKHLVTGHAAPTKGIESSKSAWRNDEENVRVGLTGRAPDQPRVSWGSRLPTSRSNDRPTKSEVLIRRTEGGSYVLIQLTLWLPFFGS